MDIKKYLTQFHNWGLKKTFFGIMNYLTFVLSPIIVLVAMFYLLGSSGKKLKKTRV